MIAYAYFKKVVIGALEITEEFGHAIEIIV